MGETGPETEDHGREVDERVRRIFANPDDLDVFVEWLYRFRNGDRVRLETTRIESNPNAVLLLMETRGRIDQIHRITAQLNALFKSTNPEGRAEGN